MLTRKLDFPNLTLTAFLRSLPVSLTNIRCEPTAFPSNSDNAYEYIADELPNTLLHPTNTTPAPYHNPHAEPSTPYFIIYCDILLCGPHDARRFSFIHRRITPPPPPLPENPATTAPHAPPPSDPSSKHTNTLIPS